VTKIGFGPSIKNVAMKKSPVSKSVGNNQQLVMTKYESRSPHPHAFLKIKNTFSVEINRMGKGKSMALLSANVNVLSAFCSFPHPPRLLVTR
jgi:hypothetical protein